MTGSRTLLLLRHAKAEPVASDDHARSLTDRGRRDALEVGVWLAGRQLVPDYAMVSSATRTVGTWEAVAQGSRPSAEVVFEDALYTAGPDSALDVLRRAPLDASCLLYVGHNPTTAYLAHVLDDGEAEPSAFRAMSEGYPTAAVTVLRVEVPWADLAEGTGRIADFHVGSGAAR